MTARQKTVLKILEVKGFTKERLASETGTALDRLKREQKNLDVLDATYKQTNADFTTKQINGSLRIQEVELYYAYLKHLGRQIEQQKSIVAIRAVELDKARHAMVEAHKEQRLFEILQGRMSCEEAKEAGQTEQKDADFNYLSRKAKG